ncbi:hypothetical protein QQ045_024943 [Rhodiola kirilowii]
MRQRLSWSSWGRKGMRQRRREIRKRITSAEMRKEVKRVERREVLDVFHRWSGLCVNTNKSAIFFGGVNEGDCNILASIMGFGRGKFPFTYLGIPMDVKALRCESYNVLVENMTSKIQGWAARCLSYAGRLVLVKHVLSMICSYWMRVLPLPKIVLKKLISICAEAILSRVVFE